MPKFHERLKLLRTQKDISQQILADQISLYLGGAKSCSKSSINMYERGEREPGLDLLEAFADFQCRFGLSFGKIRYTKSFTMA